MLSRSFKSVPLATVGLCSSRQSLRSFSSMRLAFNAAKKSPQPPKKTNWTPLVLLGAAALGLTWYNLNNPSKPPRASVTPSAKPHKDIDSPEKPLFKPGEITLVYVLGGPGSGKGTQCAKLVNGHNFVHLSAGDLLRAEQKNPDSKYGALIASYIKEGQIVPQEITVALLKQAVVDNYNAGKTRFLVDGFPRKMDQAQTFETDVASPAFILFFQCPDQVMLERILERGKTSGRTDDNVESIQKRFRTFRETSMPVVDYYEKQGKVVTLSCNEPVDVVYGHVVDAIKKEGIE